MGTYLHEFTDNEREISIPLEAKPRAVLRFCLVRYWIFRVHFLWTSTGKSYNSRAMSALTFLLFKLNTVHKETPHWNFYIQGKLSHGVMVCVIYTTAIMPRWRRQGGCFVTTQYHVVQIILSENRNSNSVWKLNKKLWEGVDLHSSLVLWQNSK